MINDSTNFVLIRVLNPDRMKKKIFFLIAGLNWPFLVAQTVKNLPAMQET